LHTVTSTYRGSKYWEQPNRRRAILAGNSTLRDFHQ